MTAIAAPPVTDLVRPGAYRNRHRTTEIIIHKCSPAGAQTADEVAAWFLSSPEGVATVTMSGRWSDKLPVFYGWAKLTSCPVCRAPAGVPCSGTHGVRNVPHPQRPGVVPAAKLREARVPYHFMVDPNGRITQHLPLLARGAHARRANGRSIGVALVGDFEWIEPTESALTSLRWLLKWLTLDAGMLKAMNADQGRPSIRGHDAVRDIPKGCPGRHLVPVVQGLDSWVDAVRQQLNLTGPGRF